LRLSEGFIQTVKGQVPRLLLVVDTKVTKFSFFVTVSFISYN